ncbi:MarR family winged helix-turn-helix transcriptional regulator [Aestuariivirga sp.]|uniref:MarR family winged helix-turn-helix transcriptional regulator n=1 Tax=Aestuariivirga sp. TaxID=2650926 RepID=UPI00359363AD
MSDEDDEQADGATITWPLERLARLMRSREHDDGLNPAQWEALRYLDRANRFSNSPGALTHYLGATKGTISQTLISLERKGFIAKSARLGERRSVSLSLTPKGHEVLARDPWNDLASSVDGLGGKTRRRLNKGLRELLAEEVKRGGLSSFGSCSSCRYFREKGRDHDPQGPHLCMLFEQPLSPEETRRICVAHEEGG